MVPRSDPYRVLGLVPGATPGEIRSAYRRLAKMHHPDTAGDRSLPRFLAIKAAYEELVDPDGRLRARGWPTQGTPNTRPANPSAKGASRDAWRARRTSGAEAGSKAGAASADDDAGRASGAKPGPTRPSGSDRPKRPSGTRRSSERRTAKPGSTTYDEAAQPLDPSWDGAGWYGASSGRYWTLNPKEYADPRKHGPEYQERARRAAELEADLRARRLAQAAALEPSAAPSQATDSASPTGTPPASAAAANPKRAARGRRA